MKFHAGSLVTQSIQYAEGKQDVISGLIPVLTKLGRRGPSVDRKSGTLEANIVKSSTPWRRTSVQVTVTELNGRTSVLLAVKCEKDDEDGRTYSVKSMQQLVRWLISPETSLTLISAVD
jgi:hypothetical protein